MNRIVISEYESKNILRKMGIRVSKDIIVHNMEELPDVVSKIGFPLAIKACREGLAHKTEQGLVFLNVKSLEEAKDAFREIKKIVPEADILVQEMVDNKREIVVGFIEDNIMGPCIMFGLGGIFTEILKDVTFRLAPVSMREAMEMLSDIKAKQILDGIRGLPPVDRESLCDIIVKVSNILSVDKNIKEVDINPICFDKNGIPIVVDCSITKIST